MKKILLITLIITTVFANNIKDAKTFFENKNYKEALKIFQKSSSNPEAQYYLGKAYLYGMGVDINKTKAVDYAVKSANAGLPAGFNLLGVLYQYGEGVVKNENKAVSYYQKAIKLNSTKAMNNLGVMYAKGIYLKKDIGKAIKLFEHSAKLNNIQAINTLADIYQKDTYGVKDVNKTISWYLKAIELKDNISAILLADIYFYGDDGVKKDIKKALLYYEKSASLNNEEAMYSLGLIYHKGMGVKQNTEKAIYWYKRAIDFNNPEGYLGLADLYANILKDDDIALKYELLFVTSDTNIDKTATLGSIAFNYLRRKDNANFYKYYKQVAKSKEEIFYMCSFLVINPSIKIKKYEYTEWIRKAAKLGNEMAIRKLFSLLQENPELAIEKNEYIYWLQRAIKLNNTYATTLLYEKYLSMGRDKEAFNLAKNAYKTGNLSLGCRLSSDLYFNEINIKNILNIELSHNIATDIIKQKSNLDITTCYRTLSNIYAVGNYYSQDINKSLSLLIASYQHTNIRRKNLLKNLEKTYNKNSKDYKSAYSSSNGNINSQQVYIVRSIAEIYLEKLHDFQNAEKWYQITYDLTKDTKYLSKTSQYESKLPKMKNEDKNSVQKVFPIIDNFNRKENVSAVLESDKYFFIATFQKSIRIYDKKTLELKKELRGWIDTGINGVVGAMAFDEKRGYLYYSTLNSDYSQNSLIRVFNINNGKIVKTIKNINAIKITYLEVSKDGHYLIVIDNFTNLNIINLKNQKKYCYNFSSNPKFLKTKIMKMKNDYILDVLGNDNKIYTFSVNKHKLLTKQGDKNTTQFRTFNAKQAVKIENQYKITNIEKIAFIKNKLYVKIDAESAIKVFNLRKLKLSTTEKKIDFSVKDNSIITIELKDNNRTMEVYENSKLLSEISFITIPILNYKVIKDKYIVVTSKDLMAMYIFNLQGRAIAQLSGFLSLQTSIIYKDGYLITYGNDSIIHIWNMDDLDTINRKKVGYDKKLINSMNRTLGGNMLDMNLEYLDMKEYSKDNNLSYVSSKKQMKSFLTMLYAKKEIIYPLASLYIKNNEWIIYDRKGLFTSSAGGVNLIKYHLNQGLYKEAKIIKNEQILENFYRPDLILKKLTKQKVNFNIDVNNLLQKDLAPQINIIKTKPIIKKEKLQLTLKITPNSGDIGQIRIYLDGVQVQSTNRYPTDKRGKNYYVQFNIKIPKGKHTIKVIVYNEANTMASSASIHHVISTYESKVKPNIYLLAIGIDKYKDPSNNLKYAVADAKLFAKTIQSNNKDIYNDVKVKLLTTVRDTSKNSIIKALKSFEHISADDLFIFMVSSHGMLDDAKYYMITSNVGAKTIKQIKREAVSQDMLRDAIANIPTSKKLIIFDTCHAGALGETLKNSFKAAKQGSDKVLSHSIGTTIISASSSKQTALEGYKGQGLLSYVLIDGFKGKADTINVDNYVDTVEITEYVKKEVSIIAKKVFKHTQEPFTSTGGKKFIILELK